MRFIETIFPFTEKAQVSSPMSSTSSSIPRKSKKDLIYDTITVIPRISADSESPQNSPIEPNTSPIQPNTNSMTSSQPLPTSISSSVPPNSHHMQTRGKSGIVKPKQQLSLNTITKPVLPKEPTSVTDAMKNDNWKNAMVEEFNALIDNGTWTLVPRHSSMNVVGSKWIFRLKQKSDGSLDRYKARLIAKGYTQERGVDFAETFSPVVKHATIRLVLTHAIAQNWKVRQLDVKNAFLNGTLNEDVYMSHPPGFKDKNFPNYVCKLNKSIYGLRQSSRAWFQKFSKFLLSYGFFNSKSDSSMFILRSNNDCVVVLVYVDDIIVTGSSDSMLSRFLGKLKEAFPVTDLGDLHYFLGIQVTRSSSGMFLSQSKYAKDILEKWNMQFCKPVSTPVVGNKLSITEGHPMENPTLYRQLAGALQYLTITRPDLSFAVNCICQFMHSPTNVHYQAAKRILRYVAGTIDYGLHLSSHNPQDLFAYSDADWAGCPDTRCSTTGMAIYYGNTLVSWASQKQHIVSRSSTEAEYRAVAATVAELTWLHNLTRELGIPLHHKPMLFCDNVSTIYLTANPVYHARTKHLELDFHFVREKVSNGELVVRYIPTDQQVADILTKSMSTSGFSVLRDKLHIKPCSA